MSDATPPEAASEQGPHEQPLTAAVIAPGWALAYSVSVLVLNLALQLGAQSEAVLGPLRSVVSAVARPGGVDRALAAATLSTAIIVASYGLMLVPALAIAVIARRRGVSLSAAVGLRPTSPGRTLVLALLVVAGGSAFTFLYAALAQSLGIVVRGNTAPLVSGFGAGWAEMLLAFLLVGIVAPAVEEITFRGIIFPSLRSAWGTWPAMVVSGAVFGIVHLQLTIALPLAVVGMALAAVFMRSRSLWTPIAAHCAFNVTSLALAFAVLR